MRLETPRENRDGRKGERQAGCGVYRLSGSLGRLASFRVLTIDQFRKKNKYFLFLL
jgi:hypothetical protein